MSPPQGVSDHCPPIDADANCGACARKIAPGWRTGALSTAIFCAASVILTSSKRPIERVFVQVGKIRAQVATKLDHGVTVFWRFPDD